MPSSSFATTLTMALAVLLAGGTPATVAAGDARKSSTPTGSVAAQPATAARGPAFEYAYRPPSAPDLQPIYQRVVEADLWRQLPEQQELDGLFALPRRLRFVTAECGEPGAFYRPAQGVLVTSATLRSGCRSIRSPMPGAGSWWKSRSDAIWHRPRP